MRKEQCTSLPEWAVDSLQTSSSDTPQLSLLSGMDMPAKSLENEPQTDGSPTCECGKGTSDCLIHPSTPEKWTAFMRASLAKTLASLESKQAYLMEPDQVFTEKFCVSLAWYDQSSFSWKTSQRSLVTDWEPYSETWPRWGMTQGGCAYAHPMSERRITETDGSYFPTPTTIDAGTGRFNTSIGGMPRPTLAMMAKRNMWPTPNASDCRDRVNMSNPAIQRRAAIGKQLNLSMVVHLTPGQLNPSWVEWLMNFPLGFTKTS